jgi:hypothetical protein
MKLVQERTAFKVLLERNGLLLSFTTKKMAFFLFLSGGYVGLKVAPTTDPDIGIVELSGYDIPTILRNWDRLSRVKVAKGSHPRDPYLADDP